MGHALASAHVPTMMLMLLIVSGVMAVAVLFVGQGQGRNAGLLWWGGGLTLNTIAVGLFVLAAENSGPWPLVAGYCVQSAGYAAVLHGVAVSFSRNLKAAWLWLPAAIVVVLSVAFAHDAEQMVRLVELVLVVQLAAIGWAALRGRPAVRERRPERGRVTLAIGVVIGTLSYFQRVAQAWLDPQATLDLVSSDAWQTMSYIDGIAGLLLATLGLVLMHKERAEADAQHAHARLVEVERERARLDERRRLLQDVHDGFGSQLAAARLRALDADLTQPQMEETLRECLDDLHLVVDTLNSADNSLENALIDYRHRMQRRLAKLPVAVEWQLALQQCPPLDERVILQLLRIVQEALANALKHAGAPRILIMARCDGDAGLQLVVADEGAGMPADVRHGRGLDSMRGRARDIGADLRWEATGHGTRVVLTLPVVRLPAEA